MLISDRIILKTIDGKIIVRPIADKESIINLNPRVDAYLNELGILAWNNGLDLTHDCFMGYIDTKCYNLKF